MLAAGIEMPQLEELEAHLREEMERQVQSGMSGQRAFTFAAGEIGAAKQIKTEFMKLKNWNHPVIWIAWGLFVVSFFLPACNETWGWQCAWLSASVPSWDWKNFSQGDWGDIYLASLTLANLLTVASPLLLSFSKFCSLKLLRWLFFGAWILVWSYIFEMIIHGSGSQLKIGCYLWILSFLMLWLSTFTICSPKTLLEKNV